MKWSILISLLVASISLSSQDTFNRVYDLDENVPRNYFKDMLVVDDDIFTLTTIFCDYDTTYFECTALTKHDITGELVSMVVEGELATFNGGPDCMAFDGDQLILSANELYNNFDSSHLYRYDLDLERLSTRGFYAANEISNIVNEGVLILDGYKYLYGNIRNASTLADSVQIIKLDHANNEIWHHYYSAGNSNLDINNLQPTPDGNLAFILAIVASPGANTGFNGYQINKIDTSGIVLNTFLFEDYGGAGTSRLLVDSSGSFYFTSGGVPNDPSSFTPVGMINKLDSDLANLEWSFIPPNDPLNDGRFYRFYDYTEAQNGDIIVCGMARDDTDSEIEGPDKHTVWNGCVLRFNPEGDIIWLRILKQENDLLSKDEFGRFRPSRLNEIIELDDGRLLAAGQVFVNNYQFSNINEFEQEAFHSLMIMMDENGCVENYPCEEIIRFTNDDKYTYSIGAQWIYETEASFVGPPSTEFIVREVRDTVMQGDRVKYIGAADTFYVENRKMYFWDDHYEEYVMYFDFASTTEYDIKYYDEIMDVEGIATIVIDSTGYELISGDYLGVQYVTVINSGSNFDPYQTKVYDGIGDADQDIRFLLGCGLCDPPRRISQIRCFTNDTISYQFVPYPCDTIFVTTNVTYLPERNLTVYPNPTSGLINIGGLDGEAAYELYSVDGKRMQNGQTNNQSLFIETLGLYLLKIKVDDQWIVKKVVR